MASASKDAAWFAERVARSEQRAARNPAAYRRQVRRLARLGTFIVPAFVLLFLSLAGFEVWRVWHAGNIGPLGQGIKHVAVFLVPAIVLCWSAWVRFPVPDGLPLARADCPKLFALTDELSKACGIAVPHAVYLSKDLNAAVVQRPRYGLLGGHRDELIIGLPLVQMLSEKEFSAVLAHEFGHFSNADGKAGAMIYRSRLIWARIAENMEHAGGSDFLLNGFARWYVPRLLADSFAFARSNEYDADRMAARIAGSAATAAALSRFGIGASFLDGYWQGVWREPLDQPTPSALPYREMGVFLPKVTEWDQAIPILEAELQVPTSMDDTHPALADRLVMLGQTPALPSPVSRPASLLLGDFLDAAIDRFDAEWRESVAAEWAARHQELTQDHGRLKELDAAAQKTSLSIEASLERAALAGKLLGQGASVQAFMDCLNWHKESARAWLVYGLSQIGQDHDAAHEAIAHALDLAGRRSPERYLSSDWYEAGRQLIAVGDELGIACLEKASSLDTDLLDECAHLIDAFRDRISAEARLQEMRGGESGKAAA